MNDVARGRVLVIDNHDSYTYNLVQLIAGLTGVLPDVVTVDRFSLEDEKSYAAIVVSPGPGHPAQESEFQVCLQLFRSRTGPILGVCLGFQGMIVAHGGSVQREKPAHGVVESLDHDGSGIFQGLSRGTRVVRYHSLAARDVPSQLRVTAATTDGLVMAVADRELPHYGVQFHPESILSEEGGRLMENFLTLAGVPLAPCATDTSTVSVEESRCGSNDEGLLDYSRWLEPSRVADRVLRGRRRAFWLDSADRREWTGRYSVMGYLSDEEPSVVVGADSLSTAAVRAIPRSHFLSRVAELCRESARDELADVPAIGGWVGVAGYETQELADDEDQGSAADGFFMQVNRVIVFDHSAQTVKYGARTEDQAAQLRIALDEVVEQDGSPSEGSESGTPSTHPPSTSEYEEKFGRMLDALLDGDTYEAVLTLPLELTLRGDPLDHYLSLRDRSPAPFAAYLRHEREAVLSASPERMLSVTTDGVAEIRPIKGTLPRSSNRQEDALAKWRLATDDKFRRENLMITDLVRNDLGRVSRPGSVAVTQLMKVESYRRVHQLVTAVSGVLRPELCSVDALRAVFPAGSMTGAPKKRTMQLIRQVEAQERGLYAGVLGWFTRSRCEFSVVIRTLHGTDDRFRLGVGGGIVVGSTAPAEFAEAMDKANSVVNISATPAAQTVEEV